MDIPALSMAMSQESVLSMVGYAVLNNTLEFIETQGSNMTKMMELSVAPEIGGTIDISI